MNILVGTTNRNKVRSVQRYLQVYDVHIGIPSQRDILTPVFPREGCLSHQKKEIVHPFCFPVIKNTRFMI